MPWSEPLRASSYDLEKGLRQVEVRDGDGVLALSVQYKYWLEHGTSALGEIVAHSKEGTARQRVRAFVLLTREAVRSARALGIRYAHAEAVPEMRAIAEAAFDVMADAGGRATWTGELADLEAKGRAKTEEDGRVKGLTPQREQELVDEMDRRATPARGARGGQ